MIKLIAFIFGLIILAGCNETRIPSSGVLQGNHWKEQALQTILPNWTKYARDTAFGAFITNLDVNWKAGKDSRKYPSMIGRHIFSYSAAYLLTGDDKYLAIAAQSKDYLIEHAWDKEFGGWYDVLNRDGSPNTKTKTMFIQIYALTGLTLYYFVTHDRDVLSYIERSNNLMEARLWDKKSGGYFNMTSADWAVTDSNKSFASQVAPVSGYLLYLSLATGNNLYLEQSKRIMDVVLAKMKDPVSGLILEDYDPDWNYRPGNPDQVNVGHNLEVAWMVLKMALLDSDSRYNNLAKHFANRSFVNSLHEKNGLWYSLLNRNDTSVHGNFNYWWIQAYGNMYSLISYRYLHQRENLADFEKGAEFWDKFFIDKQRGDTYLSVDNDGKARDSSKGNPFKTSYHSMEQCLINYLYLSLWVNHEPTALHFRIMSSHPGDVLFPFPLEDPDLKIEKAVYLKNNKPLALPFSERSLIVPLSDTVRLTVTISGKPL